jgi:hypothetical protein
MSDEPKGNISDKARKAAEDCADAVFGLDGQVGEVCVCHACHARLTQALDPIIRKAIDAAAAKAREEDRGKARTLFAYTVHLEDCDVYECGPDTCTCGLDDARKGLGI